MIIWKHFHIIYEAVKWFTVSLIEPYFGVTYACTHNLRLPGNWVDILLTFGSSESFLHHNRRKESERRIKSYFISRNGSNSKSELLEKVNVLCKSIILVGCNHNLYCSFTKKVVLN